MFRSRMAAVLAAASICCWVATATATPEYTVNGAVSDSFKSFGGVEDSYSHDLSGDAGGGAKYDSFGPGQPSYHASSSSFSGPTGLHASAHAEMEKITTGDGFYTYTQTAEGYAQAIFTDMVINAPAGVTGNVTTSYNVHLDGSFIVASNTGPSGNSASVAGVDVDFWAKGNNLGGGSSAQHSNNGTNLPVSGSDDLATFTGNNTITSPTFTVPLNTPFTVELQLTAIASVTGWENETWDLIANSDFGDTLTFATNMPVFNLPAGYTVNSADAHIVNNSYTLPEPTSLALLASGTVLLLGRRRTREQLKVMAARLSSFNK